MGPRGNDWLRHSWNEGFKRYAMTVQVTITPNGRMSLPADIRKRLGLAGGGSLPVEETPDGVILRTVAQSIAHAQALTRKYTTGKSEAEVHAFPAGRREGPGAWAQGSP